MRELAVAAALLMAAAPDGGVETKRRYEILMAEFRCDDSDGGTYVEVVHDCRVVCAGGVPMSSLADGGACLEFGPIKANPAPAGDFWAPGEWPFAPAGEARWPQR